MIAVGAHFDELFAGVDELIKRVADTENPEIRKIRAKVQASMTVAKSAFAGDAKQTRPAAATTPEDMEDPDDSEQVLSVALLVGVGLGVIMSIQQ
jgi:ElaB/YqjD/DUF883 family membrane-anchored ribosome-binding protein